MTVPRRALVSTLAVLGLALVPGQAGAIVGGQAVPQGKYPAVANVTIASLFGCTGTLVAPQWVLTAGHCSSITGASGFGTPAAFPGAAFDVVLGTVQADGTGGERVSVAQVVIPEDYLIGDSYDISLLRLTAPAQTPPTPIAGKGFEALFGTNVLTDVSGFGTLSSGGDTPDVLQEVAVPIVPDPDCADVYGGFEAETQICAGYAEGGKDSCQGDSGGPMFSRAADDRLYVVGSTSYGRGCAEPGNPGVYARVADEVLREFIRGVTTGTAVVDRTADASATPKTTYDPATKTTRTAPAPTPTAPAPSGSSGPPVSSTPTPGGGATPPPVSSSSTSPAGPAAASTSPASAGPEAQSGAAPSRLAATLRVDPARRGTVGARGLRFALGCSVACSAKLVVQVDAATAKRLGLASRVVGTMSAKGAGRGTLRLKSGLARRLMARSGVTLRVVAKVLPRAGGSGTEVSRAVRLKR